ALPDLLRVMLHPAIVRKDLGKFLLAHPNNLPLAIKHNGPARRRPLINGQNIFCHFPSTRFFPSPLEGEGRHFCAQLKCLGTAVITRVCDGAATITGPTPPPPSGGGVGASPPRQIFLQPRHILRRDPQSKLGAAPQNILCRPRPFLC